LRWPGTAPGPLCQARPFADACAGQLGILAAARVPGLAASGAAAPVRAGPGEGRAGYKELHDSALAAGVLDARTKELIALAIAVSKECDGCIAAHAHAAVQHGATPQEAAEAIGVTFLMNGGPATVYGARAFAAFREFYDQRAAADGRRPARSRPGPSAESARSTATSTRAERDAGTRAGAPPSCRHAAHRAWRPRVARVSA
jgi:AhpD family alkylhydroperoxidase